jgi:hypothetical protein
MPIDCAGGTVAIAVVPTHRFDAGRCAVCLCVLDPGPHGEGTKYPAAAGVFHEYLQVFGREDVVSRPEFVEPVYVRFDPDNSYNSTLALTIFLYYNGRISTYAGITPNSCASDVCRNPDPTFDPTWFGWN